MKFYIDRDQELQPGSKDESALADLITVSAESLHEAMERYIQICSTERDLRKYPEIRVWIKNSHNDQFQWTKLCLFHVQSITSERRGLSPVFGETMEHAVMEHLESYGDLLKQMVKSDELWVFDHMHGVGKKFHVSVEIETHIDLKIVQS